jgi:hypothetical protein
MPTIIAIMVLLVAGQLLIGRDYFWLPQFVLRRNMSHEKFTRTMRWLRPPARFIDRWTGKRLTFLTSPRAITVTAAACMLVALTMPAMELVPGASVAAAFALTMFGLALIAKDGLLMLFAYAAVAVTAWFVAVQLAG